MLSLLLHMHQPDYRDPKTGIPTMPWVRLHATRGYRDVPHVIAQTGARVTVNVVPSLIDQWEHYRAGGTDTHLALARRPIASLEPHEVAWLLQNFFHGCPSTFAWFPAWGELLARRDAGERFDTGRLRDVVVWSNLAWFGFSALRDHPELRELRRKGEGYTEAEKDHVLDVQTAILRELPGLYRGLPEVSCTPYYHPILPLLVDTAHARRSMPGVPDPGFRWAEDAREQLVRARARVEEWIGKPVRGLWPSEGSVSPEVIELAADAGYKWFATDEEVLTRSGRDPGDIGGPWEVGRMRGIFRDHGLSDRVGFVYSSWRGEEAAADLLHRLGDRPRLLALDGENPWESYRDAGEHFLRALLGRARTRTCGEMAADRPRGRVHSLHTGSWIGGDFKIWIGHPEDRAAWELLRDARAEWERRGRPPGSREHLLSAQGSDWFWWYGDEFSTPFEGEFDRLFRAHLIAAWEAMGGPVPPALLEPIKRAATGIVAPLAPLPADGDDWFAWASAGRVALRAGAMAPVRGMPRSLLFGERDGKLHLKLVPSGEGWVVHGGGAAVPFEGDRAVLDDGDIVLAGPHGLRVPGEGVLRLPWRERGPGVPER
ncbi:MAG: glycoside hydrolase family 57 protein [Pseudomonadota bacterium]|nr:glycoside hydrolase family 57 protein [Pseudomonadota bacterium]